MFRSLKPHGDRLGAQPLPRARVAGLGDRPRPPATSASSPRLLDVEARELHAGAVALLAPAVARVVGEEPRVERLEAASAARAGALGGEQLAVAHVARRGRIVATHAALAALADLGGRAAARLLRRSRSARRRGAQLRGLGRHALRGRRDLEHADHVAAELERLRERVRELAVGGRRHVDLRDRQLDVVLLESIEPRPRVGRRHRRRRRAASDSRGSTPSRRAPCSSPCGRSRAARAARSRLPR